MAGAESSDFSAVIMLCDSVACPEGKLYIQGGGWQILQSDRYPVRIPRIGMAVIVTVPFVRTNERHELSLSFRNGEGRYLSAGGAAGRGEPAQPIDGARPQDLPPAGRAIPGGRAEHGYGVAPSGSSLTNRRPCPMRQDPPAAVAPVIPAIAPRGVSARRSGVATLAKPNVRPGVQPGWPVRRLASCAHPAGVSARIHASGWLPASRCAGRSQDAAAAGQSTTARTWPAPAVQAAASASAAPAEAVWRPWPMAIVSALEARSIRMSRSNSAAVWGCGARVAAG